MIKVNKILLLFLPLTFIANILLAIYCYNIRKDFYNNIKENITSHIISGRLDNIKEQFKMLKKHNFSTDITSEWIYQAALHAHSNIMKYLLENKINLELKSDMLPLVAVFRNNDSKTVDVLIKYGLKFSAEDLSCAAYWGSFEIVQMILKSNKFSNKDYTDALFASLSFFPNLNIVKELIKNGANLNSKNQYPINEEDFDKTPVDMVKSRIKSTINDKTINKQWLTIKKYLEGSARTRYNIVHAAAF